MYSLSNIYAYMRASTHGQILSLGWYRFLKRSPHSSYREFLKEHKQFLRENPTPDERQCKRWLRFIERPGVECAIWLFMCMNLYVGVHGLVYDLCIYIYVA